MENDTNNAVVAVYESHDNAESAIKKLAEASIPMEKLSVIGKGYHTDEKVVGFYNTGDRVKVWGKFGAFWGGLMGILFGSALFFVPVIGHVIILGPLAATIYGGLQGAVLVGGASALVGALSAIGIPRDSVLRYETALKADKFLLIVHGDAQEIKRAHELLTTSGLVSFDHHAVA